MASYGRCKVCGRLGGCHCNFLVAQGKANYVRLKESEEKDADPISKPGHYTRLSPEPLDIIDAWGLSFYPAQVLKYIARAGFKGGADKLLEDLKKAAFYLDRWIKKVESGQR